MEPKYKHLTAYLGSVSTFTNEVNLSFQKIEKIIGDSLPLAASKARDWWSNSEVRAGGEHPRAWLRAGWEVAHVSLKPGEEAVSFTRTKD